MRLVRDPVSNDLSVLRRDATLVRLAGLGQGTVTVVIAATPGDTGVVAPQGMAFAVDGSIDLVGNEQSATENVGLVRGCPRRVLAPTSHPRPGATTGRVCRR